MSKKYRMGKRFQKVLTMGILAEIAVLVVAYFVYDWLLGEWIPSLTGGPLLAIFGSIGILAVWCTNKFLRRFNENYWYEVTEKGLRMNRGQTVLSLGGLQGSAGEPLQLPQRAAGDL